MKKLIIIGLCLIVLFSLVGCNKNKGDNILGNRFEIKEVIEESFYANVYLVVDKSTGVNYYWIAAGYGKSLTPVYDSEGKIVVDKLR
jgi:uncharacterized lipoprotein NlpE involved in copper resistance